LIKRLQQSHETLRSALVLLGVLLLCILLQGILPGLGIGQFLKILNPVMLLGIALGIVGVYGYWCYLQFVRTRPFVLMLMYLLTYDLSLFALKFFENVLHTALKVNTILFLLYLFPLVLTAWLSLINPQNKFSLARIPVLNYLGAFWIVMGGYYLFYNQHAIDMLSIIAGEYSYVDWGRFYKFFEILTFCFSFSILLQNLKEPARFFNQFSQYYIVQYLAYSILAVLFYPLHITTETIEGFERMAFIFGHPNTLGYYLALVICFTAGFAFYSLRSGNRRFAVAAFVSLPVMLMAQLTSGSKTSLFCALLSVAVVVLLELFVNRGYQIFLKIKWLYLSVTTLVLTVLLVLSSGNLSVIQSRLGDNRSLDWRKTQWSRVMENIEPASVLFGHGHTAALVTTQRYVYNTWNIRNDVQESPYIHNDYLEQFYDYGIFILVWLLGVGHLVLKHIRSFVDPSVSTAQRSLHISSFALVVMLLLSMVVEMAFYQLPVWLLIVLLYFRATFPEYSRKTNQQEAVLS
jgi:hypothetical protein